MSLPPNLPTLAVVDASVALKWILPEPGRAAALAVLDTWEVGHLDLVAPRLFMEEIASALARRFRRGLLSGPEAHQALALMELRRPALRDDSNDLAEAFALALRHRISMWDSLYLALAIRLRCDLITADLRFQRAISRHYPFVRMIG